MRIDIWSDIACPWCYIGLTRFDRVLAEFPHADEVKVTLHSFQLDPTLPESYDGTETDYLAQTKHLPEAQVRRCSPTSRPLPRPRA
jgi:predicted DsbA family dithiol-disulfide isomerase